MKVTTVGVDLAKNVLQVHGVDEHGKKLFNRQLKVEQVMPFFANLPACLVGMEACASAHYWARKLQALGHQVRLMAPQYVKPYVKTNKNDAIDAEAVCEAVRRPNMRFVAVKSEQQQAVAALHTLRASAMSARNAQANRLRGLLLEFGLRIPKGIGYIGQVPALIEDGANELPAALRIALQHEYEHFQLLEQRLARVHQQILQCHQHDAASQVLEAIPGIGALGATALVAHMGDPHNFRAGHELAAWLGIVPRQHSSGGKSTLKGISKHGNSYVRTLLIHGARSVLVAVRRKIAAGKDPASFSATERWVLRLSERANPNVACVALANKNARTAWALLAHGRRYAGDHVSLSPRQQLQLEAG